MNIRKNLIMSLLVLATAGCAKPSEQVAPTTKDTAAVSTQPIPAQQASGKLEVTPSEVKSGQKTTLRFALNDAKGQPVSDAIVTAILTMPMGKSQMKDQVGLKWDGTAYTGSIKPGMAGTWDVTVEAKREGKLVLSLPSQIEAK